MDETVETLDETLCAALSDALSDAFTSAQDPLGSYTGTPAEGDGKPEQDADDL